MVLIDFVGDFFFPGGLRSILGQAELVLDQMLIAEGFVLLRELVLFLFQVLQLFFIVRNGLEKTL